MNIGPLAIDQSLFLGNSVQLRKHVRDILILVLLLGDHPAAQGGKWLAASLQF